MTRVAKPLWVLVALILAAAASLGGEQKSESTERKDTKPAKPAAERPATPPVSPIYRAGRREPGEKAAPETDVITNEDLERMWAGLSPAERMQGVYQSERHIGAPAPGAEPGAAPPAGAGEESAADWMEKRKAAAAESEAKTAEAEKKVADLRAKVEELDRRLLAVRNPLLPRRYSDRKDEDNKKWDEMNNPERVAATEEELKKTREDLAAAEQELSRLRGAKP